MKAVLDTNVLVSGMINPAGAPGRLIDRLRAGALQAVVDDSILAEYAHVLRRPSLQVYFSSTDTELILDYLAHHAEHVLADVCVPDLPDPDDAPFLEAALAAGVPLITGNKKHFPKDKRRGCDVLSPAEFITRFCVGPPPPP